MQADHSAPVCESGEIVVRSPPELVWDTAVHVWRMERQGAGTRVLTEESWSGPLARVFARFLRKTVKQALDQGLPALKSEAEGRARST